MPTYEKIASSTVGSGGATGVTFSNIPQSPGYTDLLLKVSVRTSYAYTYQDMLVLPNGSGAGISVIRLYGNGSGISTTGSGYFGVLSDAATSTASIFSSGELYITNYKASNYKAVSIDSSQEDNTVGNFMEMQAGLWSNTAAITSLEISSQGQTIVQYSTFTLYGISNA